MGFNIGGRVNERDTLMTLALGVREVIDEAMNMHITGRKNIPTNKRCETQVFSAFKRASQVVILLKAKKNAQI